MLKPGKGQRQRRVRFSCQSHHARLPGKAGRALGVCRLQSDRGPEYQHNEKKERKNHHKIMETIPGSQKGRSLLKTTWLKMVENRKEDPQV